MPQNCCVPGGKINVYEEDGVKISFHKFPEDRELFRKWIVAIRRDVGKEFRVTDQFAYLKFCDVLANYFE